MRPRRTDRSNRLTTRARLAAAMVLAGLLGRPAARGETVFPPEGWTDQPDPIASPQALVGGEITEYGGEAPATLNYYLHRSALTARVFRLMFESLIEIHPVTLECVPAIAARWSIDADERSVTFHIDPAARWSDGRPITARDVVGTYRAVMRAEGSASYHKLGLGRLETPVATGPRTVVFRAREAHWQNLTAAGGFHILPMHVVGERGLAELRDEFPVVSGPYRLGDVREGISMTMVRREDWWRRNAPRMANAGNFELLRFRFFSDRENAFEAFKDGRIDVFEVYSARRWRQHADLEGVRKNWIVRQRVYNHRPIGFQGFAMNMRRPPFSDRRVRKAMAHLVDRRTMNRTLMHDQYFLHRSYYEDLYDRNNPCPNPAVRFDPEAAAALLDEAGWRLSEASGRRERNGEPLRFTFLARTPAKRNFLRIVEEALGAVGIAMEIRELDPGAWAEAVGRFDFDMVWATWRAGLLRDPEPMWSSNEARREGSSNITGFTDPRVDALIKQQRGLPEVDARHAICRRIDQILVEQFPYVLLWNTDCTRVLYWNRFGTPETVLSKYGRTGTHYWWYDSAAAEALRQAMEDGTALPRRPPVVRFDDAF